MSLTIRWLREGDHPNTVAHALAHLALQPRRGRDLDPVGTISPVCMGPNSTLGDDRARWVHAPYAQRCRGCMTALTNLLGEATNIPTAPVLVRVSFVALVDPLEVDHARRLIESYVMRTKTFNRHKAPEISVAVDE